MAQTTTFRMARDAYLERKKSRNLRPVSLTDLERKFAPILRRFGEDTPLAKVKESDVESWRQDLREEGLKDRTRSAYIRLLRSLYRFAITKKWVKEDPTASLESELTDEEEILAPLTLEEVKKIISTALEMHQMGLVIVMVICVLTALRIKNVLSLTWRRLIDGTKTGELRFTAKEMKNRKRGHIVYVSSALAGFIHRMSPATKALQEAPIVAMTYKKVDKMLAFVCSAMEFRKVHLHEMRTFVASELFASNIEEKLICISRVLSHGLNTHFPTAVTALYAKMNATMEAKVRLAYEAIPNVAPTAEEFRAELTARETEIKECRAVLDKAFEEMAALREQGKPWEAANTLRNSIRFQRRIERLEALASGKGVSRPSPAPTPV